MPIYFRSSYACDDWAGCFHIREPAISCKHTSRLRNPCIGAVLSHYPHHAPTGDVDYCISPDDALFVKLGALRSVTLKMKEIAVNKRPAIARPVRDVREVLKEVAADGNETLDGIFSLYADGHSLVLHSRFQDYTPFETTKCLNELVVTG
ncbi:hypothetical protein BU15DRAFT_78651 [Melanogaster broomeanus]|nr:hypothetical protein BU15DRAFT_78651 [Melanogaster broomeanus]